MDLASPENVTGQTHRAETGNGGREESGWREKLMGIDRVIGEGEAGEP